MKIYVMIGGGCFLGAENIPAEIRVGVIDWDNLLDEDGMRSEWERTDLETREFIMKSYPNEHALIQRRLAIGI